jgi:hypothetical protein
MEWEDATYGIWDAIMTYTSKKRSYSKKQEPDLLWYSQATSMDIVKMPEVPLSKALRLYKSMLSKKKGRIDTAAYGMPNSRHYLARSTNLTQSQEV